MRPIDPIALDRELGARSMFDFIDLAWHLVEPGTPYKANWHIEAICEHLEAVLSGQVKTLVISIPPGCMKSLTCSVFFGPAAWIKYPQAKIINASFSEPNMKRDALRSRNIIDSRFYQERWGDKFKKREDSWTLKRFDNDKGGFRYYATVEGAVTGEHGHVHVIDDPIKAAEGQNPNSEALITCIDWFTGTMSTRFASGFVNATVLIMQRLSQMDLAGYVLSKELDATHLMLPQLYDSKRKCTTSIGFSDPRTEEGELLFPQVQNEERVEKLRRDLGVRGFEAQEQQNPLPEDGNLIKKAWTQHRYKQGDIPRNARYIQSWDCAFEGKETSDYVVGQVWAMSGSRMYLVDQLREKLDFVETKKAIKAMSKKWPKAYTKIIEKKANGAAVIASLKRTIGGIVEYNPTESKGARLFSVSDAWEAGDVWLPRDEDKPWVEITVAEHTGFPNASYDDTVDAAVQAIKHFRDSRLDRLKAAMENVDGQLKIKRDKSRRVG